MKTIIVEQPLATLIVHGVEQYLPSEFNYLLRTEKMVLVAAGFDKPAYNSLPQDIQDKYNRSQELNVLTDYDKLPTKKFIGFIRVNNGHIIDAKTLTTPQKLPSAVKPYNTLFEFDIQTNQTIYRAIAEYDRTLERGNKREKYDESSPAVFSSDDKDLKIQKTDSNIADITPKATTDDEAKKIATIIGVIVTIGLLIGLLVIGDGNILMAIGSLVFVFFLVFNYFR